MKGLATGLWAAGVLGGLLTGVHTLSAETPIPPPDPDRRCYVCEWRFDGESAYQVCFEISCSEVEP
ncbi:MAG TPA: hypothetical protein VF615_23460 [Longimicrobiaceae bacterium]|jgi:hypothetical protein